jgi:hypothetical protein
VENMDVLPAAPRDGFTAFRKMRARLPAVALGVIHFAWCRRATRTA